MPSNVEIKARLTDRARARAVAVAKELSGGEGEPFSELQLAHVILRCPAQAKSWNKKTRSSEWLEAD